MRLLAGHSFLYMSKNLYLHNKRQIGSTYQKVPWAMDFCRYEACFVLTIN